MRAMAQTPSSPDGPGPALAVRSGAEPSPPDLQTLRVVLSVAEAGSISGGSDRLGLAVAAASARISALEASLGVRVFERSPRGVELTPAGRMLVQRGAEVLAEAERLAADLRDCAQGLAGRVRLLANASALLQALPERLERFARAHPRIRVDVAEGTSLHILGELIEGRADVGVVDAARPTQGLEFVPFCRDDLVLVVPREHPLAGRAAVDLQVLLTQPLIDFEGANAVSTRLRNAAAGVGRALDVRLRMRSFDAACRLVAAGLGLSVMPRQALGPQLTHLPLRALPIDEPWACRTHHLALRAGPHASAAAHTLVQVLAREG
jgi:DNA-binding transcriptional LysR family regulator